MGREGGRWGGSERGRQGGREGVREGGGERPALVWSHKRCLRRAAAGGGVGSKGGRGDAGAACVCVVGLQARNPRVWLEGVRKGCGQRSGEGRSGARVRGVGEGRRQDLPEKRDGDEEKAVRPRTCMSARVVA